jgi:hypothetical protein
MIYSNGSSKNDAVLAVPPLAPEHGLKNNFISVRKLSFQVEGLLLQFFSL